MVLWVRLWQAGREGVIWAWLSQPHWNGWRSSTRWHCRRSPRQRSGPVQIRRPGNSACLPNQTAGSRRRVLRIRAANASTSWELDLGEALGRSSSRAVGVLRRWHKRIRAWLDGFEKLDEWSRLREADAALAPKNRLRNACRCDRPLATLSLNGAVDTRN